MSRSTSALLILLLGAHTAHGLDPVVPPVPEEAARLVVCSSSALLREFGLLANSAATVSPSQPVSAMLDAGGGVLWARWALPGTTRFVGVGEAVAGGSARLVDRLEPREGCWFWSRSPGLAVHLLPGTTTAEPWMSDDALKVLSLPIEDVAHIGGAAVAAVSVEALKTAGLAASPEFAITLPDPDGAIDEAATPVGGILHTVEAIVTHRPKMPRGATAGVCEAFFVVRPDGTVRRAFLTGEHCPDGYRGLAESALLKWRFAPADGSTTDVRYRVKRIIDVKGPR